MAKRPAPASIITIPVDLNTSAGRNLFSSALKANAVTPVAADGARPELVQNIKRGEYVKRAADAKKVYTRGAYVGRDGYELVDCEDTNRTIFVKRGTILFIGFTY